MESQKVNRKRRPTDLPLCKYGLNCYQKNPEHQKKYLHPEDPLVETQNTTDDSVTDTSLSARPSRKSPLKSPALSPTKKLRSNSKSKDAEEVKKPLSPNNKDTNSLKVPSLRGKSSRKSPVRSPYKKNRSNSKSKQVVAVKKPLFPNNEVANSLEVPSVPSSKSPVSSPAKSPAKIWSNPEIKVVEEVKKLLFPDAKMTETVEDVLNSMPKDFFDFWKFCSSVNKSKPEDALSELGLHLVGIYDLLANKLPKDQKVCLHSHWRYFYDPPEFQTVVKLDGKDLHHIGYFRDDPSEKPCILASNSAALGPKLTLKGDNIFAAVHSDLTTIISKKLKAKQKNIFSKILEDLEEFAKKKKYSLDTQSAKTKARNKKVVAKTFHGLGIVVPLVNSVGYRPLPDSNETIKAYLKRIINTERFRSETKGGGKLR